MNDPEIRAKIVDIKADLDKKVAIVGVEITRGTETWHKAFRLSPETDQAITLADFQEQLKVEIAKDIEWRNHFAELEAKKGQSFILTFTKK